MHNRLMAVFSVVLGAVALVGCSHMGDTYNTLKKTHEYIEKDQHESITNSIVEAENRAREGDIESQYLLGRLLVITGNKEEGDLWIEKAAMGDHPLAQLYILQQEGDAEAAVMIIKKLAASGHPYGQYLQALIHDDKGEENAAEQYMSQSASSGYPPAQKIMGILSHAKDKNDEARQWYEQAIENGSRSTGLLLYSLLKGEGNENEGLMWLEKAVGESVNPALQITIAQIHSENGNMDDASKWYERAGKSYTKLIALAEDGYPHMQYRLGHFLLLQNKPDQAKHWFEEAKRNGHQGATSILEVLKGSIKLA